MENDSQAVLENEVETAVENQPAQQKVQRELSTEEKLKIATRQNNQRQKLLDEQKAENEKLRRERDELLQKAQTADEAAEARRLSDVELLKADTLADLGRSPSLRAYIKATDPEGIKAEVEKLEKSLGMTMPQQQPETPAESNPEPEKPKPHTARPEPREKQAKPNLSKMTDEQKLEYFGDALDDMQFGDEE